MSTVEEQPSGRTPKRAKLPQVPLNEAIEIATALSELGSPATPFVVAQHMGTGYKTNARFRSKLGAAGYFGLTEKRGDRRALTPRGEAIVGENVEAGQRARREAVMSTSFGPILHSLRGRPVNESAITLRLKSDYDVPDKSASTIATALIDSAAQSGLSSNGSLDAQAIEATADAMPKDQEELLSRTARHADRTVTTKTPKPQKEQAQEVDPRSAKLKEKDSQRPFPQGVQVVLKIDASSLTPQQVAELVRELRQ